MKKDEAYWAHVNKVVSEAPPMTAAQCDLASRILLPKDWVFVPKLSHEMLDAA